MNRCILLFLALLFCHSAAAERLPLLIQEIAGIARKGEVVTSGVPFPMGTLSTNAPVRMADASGKPIPLQVRTSATWRDGSVKWLLLDFPVTVASNDAAQVFLEYGPGVQAAPLASGIRIQEQGDQFWVDTGPLKFSIAKTQFGIFNQVYLDRNGNDSFEAEEQTTSRGLQQTLTLAKEFAGLQTKVQPPTEVSVEQAGPIRAVIKVGGWITDGQGSRLVKYLFRVQAFANSTSVKVDYTTTQLADKIKMLWVQDISLTLAQRLESDAQFIIGGEATAHQGKIPPTGSVTLTQLAESSYSIKKPEGEIERGIKASGWVDVTAGNAGGVLVSSRSFWQQFPKAITVSKDGIRFGLYPAEESRPLDMDQGLAKTHEFVFAFHPELTLEALAQIPTAAAHPLFAAASTEWYCNSKVFGDLQPFNFDLFPDYETLTEASGDQFIKKMATGWRHWGDVYYGGEYKGTNSYMNLEYDVHHNFYCQFARTGLRKYLDTAMTMASHQADIDTNHKTGWQWKHSPRHVEIQAEFGHTFTRGLLETYFLTGNQRCFEAAVELGVYFSKQIRNPRELGNERQIGWSLISLLPVYEATWDQKYLEAAKQTIDRLLASLDERGKFDIRWDNRISFFNGIAATGFIYYYRATGDERVADAALRVMRRARGFYPEYAGRTLEALAWAYQRTHEPEYLDYLKLTWEETLAKVINWNVMELGAPTIFTVHALPFMAQGGFLPKPERPLSLTPEQFSTQNGLYAHHLPGGEAELYLQNQSSQPFDVVIIRKGAWKASGSATLYDPEGKPVAHLDFPKEVALWQRKSIPVNPKLKGAYRLAMRSPSVSNVKGGSFVTWDVVTSEPMRAVFSTPNHEGLQFVTPYLFCLPSGDTDSIQLELTGEGEGFKKAVIIDPDGKVAGSMEAFIDLGDKGRYQYKAFAKIPAPHSTRLWKISLQDVSASKITGVTPYFSTSEQSFFQPDRLSR
jgi:rhamnogalacturonyl hydrolase YesR